MVGEALADDALQQRVGAVAVIAAKSLTVGVAEVKFSQIAVQVLLLAVLVDALHPALEDAEIAFDGVGVQFGVPGTAYCPLVCETAL